jgi:acyl-CoA synthetase (AMP-forming)/AMP-acid ligase II
MPVEIANQISVAFPSVDDFRIGYGATETGTFICFCLIASIYLNLNFLDLKGPVATCLLKNDPFEKKMETVGKPIDFIELKVVHPETLRVLPLGRYHHNFSLSIISFSNAGDICTAQARKGNCWYVDTI